jgi:hypothetical protein
MKLRAKLNILLKRMEDGGHIKLKSGHTLVMAEGHQEPGYLATVSRGGQDLGETVFQIGSETAWMALVEHARNMTDRDFVEITKVNP